MKHIIDENKWANGEDWEVFEYDDIKHTMTRHVMKIKTRYYGR